MRRLAICAVALSVLAPLAVSGADQYSLPSVPVREKGPSGVEWRAAHEAELAAALSEQSLAALVKDEASARALLAKIRPAYQTDPLTMFQLGALGSHVMAKGRETARKTWTAALLAAFAAAEDDYVAVCCLDRLRWCGYRQQSDAIRRAAANRSRAVADFAAFVCRELDGQAVGLAAPSAK